jgi:hypothetical protein
MFALADCHKVVGSAKLDALHATTPHAQVAVLVAEHNVLLKQQLQSVICSLDIRCDPAPVVIGRRTAIAA